jgi:TRIAD3 protein (E3 ubiquitin-protein ligase RNF216)
MSGCELPFSVSELNAHLTKDQTKLRDRVHLRRDIREANIPNLASCPSCDWAAIIESCKTRYPVAQCWNAEGGCGIVFCRTCERKDHRPRTCEEEERRLAGREVVAEAMTNAVVRICPGCKSQFMKEAGVCLFLCYSGVIHLTFCPQCNLMTCPNCQTKSCYVCRKVVENKYNHFRIVGASH